MEQNKKQKKVTPSALGEKRATSGYHFQYKNAAYLIIKYLKKRQLKWVQRVNPLIFGLKSCHFCHNLIA